MPPTGGEPSARHGRGRLFVVSGPSGVGKSTVLGRLRQRVPDLWYSVSVTTRSPRPGEVDGVQYRFIDRATFDRLAAGGDLLEHAVYAGHGYGTPKEPVSQRLADGIDVLLEIEVQGARQVRAAPGIGPEAILVFLAPPSLGELTRRLAGRGTEADRARATRLAAAQQELAAADEFDHVIVNTAVDATVGALVALMTADSP